MSTPNPVPPTIAGTVETAAADVKSAAIADLAAAETDVISIIHARWAVIIATFVGLVAGVILRSIV